MVRVLDRHLRRIEQGAAEGDIRAAVFRRKNIPPKWKAAHNMMME